METVNRILHEKITAFSQREIAQIETTIETRQNLEARLIYGSYPEEVMMENHERKKDYLRDIVGALWENYIIGERHKANFNEGLHKEFYFWRTYDKQEIDLIEESADSLTALEFKWGNNMPNATEVFQEAYSHAKFHVVNRENYFAIS